MPLKWRPCEWREDGSFEGGLGIHKFALIYQHTAGGERNGCWVWTMNGIPHNTKAARLGFSDTLEEARRAASDAFDEWIEKAGLMIAP